MKYFLPFGLIFGLYTTLPHALAFMSQIDIVKFNEAKNGALILAQRMDFEAAIPPECDIYFAGTSRTMADYDPSLFAQIIQSNLGLAAIPCGLNLGNLGNSPRFLLRAAQNANLKPDLLILEFSPHIFSRDQETQEQRTIFQNYRSSIQILELGVSGYLREKLLLNGTLKIDPAAVFILARSERAFTAEEIYLFLTYSHFGRGQTYNSDGQVSYRTYLSDSEALKIFAGDIDADLDNFIGRNQAFNSDEWNAYLGIINYVSVNRIVVVRPPVSPEMYLFENEEMGKIIEMAQNVFDQIGILYIDLNPNEYSILDSSHVDWIDTDQVTTNLVQIMEQWLQENFTAR
ncbi:MAG: hypothetical protein WEC37_04435 [Anaerolineales bacterium]